MEMPRDYRGFPSGDGAGGRTPHSHAQLKPLNDMRPNALRPMPGAQPDVGPPDPPMIFAVDHGGEWTMYRKIGGMTEWCAHRRQKMWHHVLEDSAGKEWRVDWRSWVELGAEGTVRKVEATSYVRQLHGAVMADVYDWPEVLRILETIDPGEDPAESLSEHIEKNRPMVGEGVNHG